MGIQWSNIGEGKDLAYRNPGESQGKQKRFSLWESSGVTGEMEKIQLMGIQWSNIGKGKYLAYRNPVE